MPPALPPPAGGDLQPAGSLGGVYRGLQRRGGLQLLEPLARGAPESRPRMVRVALSLPGSRGLCFTLFITFLVLNPYLKLCPFQCKGQKILVTMSNKRKS